MPRRASGRPAPALTRRLRPEPHPSRRAVRGEHSLDVERASPSRRRPQSHGPSQSCGPAPGGPAVILADAAGDSPPARSHTRSASVRPAGHGVCSGGPPTEYAGARSLPLGTGRTSSGQPVDSTQFDIPGVVARHLEGSVMQGEDASCSFSDGCLRTVGAVEGFRAQSEAAGLRTVQPVQPPRSPARARCREVKVTGGGAVAAVVGVGGGVGSHAEFGHRERGPSWSLTFGNDVDASPDVCATGVCSVGGEPSSEARSAALHPGFDQLTERGLTSAGGVLSPCRQDGFSRSSEGAAKVLDLSSGYAVTCAARSVPCAPTPIVVPSSEAFRATPRASWLFNSQKPQDPYHYKPQCNEGNEEASEFLM